jgi:hypothetical protein
MSNKNGPLAVAAAAFRKSRRLLMKNNPPTAYSPAMVDFKAWRGGVFSPVQAQG